MAADDRRRDGLYTRIGYDLTLEERAFARLDAGDRPGCRTLLDGLLDGLELERHDSATRRQAAQLLLELLHRVNVETHHDPEDPTEYRSHRIWLLERFGTPRDPRAVQRSTGAALDRLLAGASAPTGVAARARSHIDEHYARRLSLSTVAAALNVSPNYLSRLFRRETGMTLTTYVQRVRLDHARRMLAEGSRRSISEIAYLVGYQNYRHFYRNFVKYEKASPRQVRRTLDVAPIDGAAS